MLLSTSAFAMGAKKPKPTPPKPPTETKPVEPVQPVVPPVSSSQDFGPPLSPSDYLDSAGVIGPQIDAVENDNELSGITRSMVNEDKIDKCFSDDNSHDYFADQIAYYTDIMLEDTPAKVGFIGSYYGTSSDDSKYAPTSLIRNPLCNVTASTLGQTINKVPAASTIARLNRFADTMNTLRAEVLEGNHGAKKELHAEWTRLFSCLSYKESLSTADAASSKSVAASVAPAGYRKPAGVKFYNDPAQNEASRLNLGLFQFTPNSGGNIQPCIRAWNEYHAGKASCKVSQSASKSELIKVLGSSLQSFNAFCGVHKLVQTFAIQVNTTKTSATHPSNLVNGKLKSAPLRCVTPHFQAGKAYNHFGPFQNSTGTNLEKLFSCIESSR